MSEPPIWVPSPQRARTSRLYRFIESHFSGSPEDYDALHRWSVTEPAQFWGAVGTFCGLKLERAPDAVVRNFDRLPGARWFAGARLNYAENLLEAGSSGTAIIAVDERGNRQELSFDALKSQVASIAAALRSAGVEPGDRVAGVLPNGSQAVVAALAAASLGAVWSSCSPDFGATALIERLAQIEPKVLFGVDSCFYNGKNLDCRPKMAALADALPNLGLYVRVNSAAADIDTNRFRHSASFEELLEQNAELRYEPVEFDHPLFILYSSGTTDVPKCIVHSVGGTLLQHLKEHQLHTDIGPDDVAFYYTTCGWMMWNWLLSMLASGATIVLYDGAPFHPDPGVLWRLCDTESITIFGTSAKYLSALEKAAYRPKAHCELSTLRTILSTGSPLAPESFDYVYADIKDDVLLASIAGGTDLISCFVLGNPLLPVFRGEIQCRGLGMDVRVFDPKGRELEHEKGELVCVKPFPSMPLGFWNDADGFKYRRAYFARFPGVWHHGDYASLTQHGGIIMHGRSDATLNPGGVRIGTAEIYRIVEQLPEIEESIVVGQDWDADVRIVLFLRLRDGAELDDALRGKIRQALREQASPRHVPAKILTVPDIPRTISGKITELAVRDAIHGREVENRGALANPDALDHFRNRPELTE